ncbi:MAG: hypothetical protein HOP02_08545 [Methylococcaceae bacterium]|nr:hypothetical protein [Methylococcaceae bacterium]
MTFETFSVVVVPFPFTNQAASKKRPALVLSSTAFNTSVQHSVLAMITSTQNTKWLLDVAITDM